MSCPWAKIEKPEPVNLEDIMSEEVARDLQAKEEKMYAEKISSKISTTEVNNEDDIPPEVLKAVSSNGFESDETIARMLQMQFDKEYDNELKRTEEKYNGSSKVSISFDNYRRTPLNPDFESESEEDEIVDIRDRKDWDRFDVLKREIASIPPCGYKVQKDGKMVTKHDVTMSGRKNACKLLSFPPEFHTGDGEKFDLKLSNKVFNSLKLHSNNEQSRRHKFHDKKEDHATAIFGMDQFTRLLIFKMINSQLLQSVNGVISIDSDPSFPKATEPLPKECVLKVFKTTLSEFKQRDKYIKNDYRFKDRIGKQTARKTVHIWAEKEMANLMRLRRAGILCPQVVTLRQHVLVMSFIGEEHKPAPKLKDAKMRDVDYIMAYEEVVVAMKTLYEKANLIHADLSEYNILWHNKHCYFIDVSQSVEPDQNNAFLFLFRDCNNIINVKIATPDELFKSITGYSYENKVSLSELQESFKMKPHLVDRPDLDLSYNFDTAWEKAKSEQISIKLETVLPKVDMNLIESPKA
ncbi:hypothetical protein NQ314_004351 [Rhamnusium bicolor]|uniref:Serine/threonine-protein kinase RIO3 n=1 Tax=Rhamnusium bicolor TaxID=1586634 RepID=A0AAV8ZM59_9CUCU|nr:hypothetical protein NQ314_004351 [Rhamnusium bicolor]